MTGANVASCRQSLAPGAQYMPTLCNAYVSMTTTLVFTSCTHDRLTD
mgnify:CR=1 FL=1